MTNVYPWPPVLAVSREWTVQDPVSVSQSMITGAEFVSAAQRRRRVAVVEASSVFAPYGAGNGYMEALKRLLKGGINLVRLHHSGTTFYCRGSEAFGWITPPTPFDWETPPVGFTWTDDGSQTYAGTITTSDGFPAVRVNGAPPNAMLATVGEFVSVAGKTFMVMAPVFADSDGVAIAKLDAQPTSSGATSFGARDTGVFKANAMPRSIQPASGDWTYTWEFTEVFEDERGPFVEVDPKWN